MRNRKPSFTDSTKNKEIPPGCAKDAAWKFMASSSPMSFMISNKWIPNGMMYQGPTKLPSYKDQFAPDGQIYFSIRETRFGVRSYIPTPLGPLTTWFEFDLFGSGADAGQTTFHLRHAYGELGKFGVGQTWSPFVDIDVFPNDLDFWGPNGMANIRNIQIRYMPIQGDTKLTIALEKPGATADDGQYADTDRAKKC